MRLGLTEDNGVRVGTELDELTQGLSTSDTLTDDLPHPDLTMFTRLPEATFPERLDPVGMKDNNPTINTMRARAPISAPEER